MSGSFIHSNIFGVTENERDRQMPMDSSHDITWVRPGREGSGTHRNLDRRNISLSDRQALIVSTASQT